MFVKIDTRPDFRILRPIISELHANMADELGKKILYNMNTPPHHLILEMDEVTILNTRIVEELWEIQSLAVAKGFSFYLTGITVSVANELSKIPAFKKLNKTPTLKEAIDLVMMDKLERELMGE